MTSYKSQLRHTNDLKFLITEVYRSPNHLNSELMWKYKYKYELRSKVVLHIPFAYTITYGINSVCFRAFFVLFFWITRQTKIMKGEKCTTKYVKCGRSYQYVNICCRLKCFFGGW